MSAKQSETRGKGRRKNVKHGLSMKVILILMAAVCGVMVWKTYQVDQEISQYAQVKDDLNTQIDNKKDEQEDIQEQISYVNSDEYIEEQAREKLGLVFDNEIIFKKQN